VSDELTFVGHATVRMELGGATLLTDPMLRRRFLHVRRYAAAPDEQVLAGLDAVLVSHLHPDHLDFRSLGALDRDVRFVVPAGGARLIRRRGFHRITELRPGQATTVGPVEVRATPAVHDGRRLPLGPAVPALGFDVRSPGSRVYFAGDTGLFEGMRGLGDGIDVALLPIGGWGPKVGRGHLDARRAAEAAAMLRPRMIVPIHWGTYLRMGLARTRPELLFEPPRRLARELAALAPDVALRVLEPGGSLRL